MEEIRKYWCTPLSDFGWNYIRLILETGMPGVPLTYTTRKKIRQTAALMADIRWESAHVSDGWKETRWFGVTDQDCYKIRRGLEMLLDAFRANGFGDASTDEGCAILSVLVHGPVVYRLRYENYDDVHAQFQDARRRRLEEAKQC